MSRAQFKENWGWEFRVLEIVVGILAIIILGPFLIGYHVINWLGEKFAS